jgi:hypothetical protein
LIKDSLSGLSSRRIDGEHRLIYRIRNDPSEVVACYGHYVAWVAGRHQTAAGHDRVRA